MGDPFPPHVACDRCGLKSATLHPSFRIGHLGWEHRCPNIHGQVGHDVTYLVPDESATTPPNPQPEGPIAPPVEVRTRGNTVGLYDANGTCWLARYVSLRDSVEQIARALNAQTSVAERFHGALRMAAEVMLSHARCHCGDICFCGAEADMRRVTELLAEIDAAKGESGND